MASRQLWSFRLPLTKGEIAKYIHYHAALSWFLCSWFTCLLNSWTSSNSLWQTSQTGWWCLCSSPSFDSMNKDSGSNRHQLKASWKALINLWRFCALKFSLLISNWTCILVYRIPHPHLIWKLTVVLIVRYNDIVQFPTIRKGLS